MRISGKGELCLAELGEPVESGVRMSGRGALVPSS